MNTPESISIPMGNALFNFRVAGIAIHEGKVLLHKTSEDNFWSLPGGRCEMFEFSKETLVREMQEETGMTIEVGKLAWVVENFFEFRDIRHHELGLYYHMEFLGLKNLDDFEFVDGDSKLLYRWFVLHELADVLVYPGFINKELLSTSDSVGHFMMEYQNLHIEKNN